MAQSQKWFNARELKGLPGLPTTEAGVLRRAKSNHWKARPRRGLGGGSEFYISSLPTETVTYLAALHSPTPPASSKKPRIRRTTKSKRLKRAPQKSLGERLRKARILLKKSPSDMALSVQVSLSTWQNYEVGKSVPGGDILVAAAKLGISGTWLLSGEGDPLTIASPHEEKPPSRLTKQDSGEIKAQEMYSALAEAFDLVDTYCLKTGHEIKSKSKLTMAYCLAMEYVNTGEMSETTLQSLFDLSTPSI